MKKREIFLFALLALGLSSVSSYGQRDHLYFYQDGKILDRDYEGQNIPETFSQMKSGIISLESDTIDDLIKKSKDATFCEIKISSTTYFDSLNLPFIEATQHHDFSLSVKGVCNNGLIYNGETYFYTIEEGYRGPRAMAESLVNDLNESLQLIAENSEFSFSSTLKIEGEKENGEKEKDFASVHKMTLTR